MFKKILRAGIVLCVMPLVAMEEQHIVDRSAIRADSCAKSFLMGLVAGLAQGGSHQIHRKSNHDADLFFDLTIIAFAGLWEPIALAYRGDFRGASLALIPFYLGHRFGYHAGRLSMAPFFNDKQDWWHKK